MTAADAAKGAADVQALLAPPAFDSRLVNLAPNSWVDLGQFNPTVPAGETLAETRLVFGNSGIVWDKKRARWVSFGGGHSGTNFNSVWTISATDLVYREEYPPTPATAMTWANYDTPPTFVYNPDGSIKSITPNAGRGCWIADGRPAARHTGQQLVVVGDTLRLLDLVEGNGANTQQAINMGSPSQGYITNCKGQIATYDFNTQQWSYENANPTQTDGDGNVALWGAALLDPINGMVVWVNSNAFVLYEPVARIKTKWVVWQKAGDCRLFDEQGNPLTSAATVQYWYTGSLVYDPAHDQYYFCSLHDDVWRVNYNRANPAATTMTLLTATGQSPYAAGAHPPNSEHTHSWDNSGVITSGPFNSKMYAFDPVIKAWSATTIAPAVGTQAGNSHYCCYSPDANVYLFLTDNSNPVTSLKYHWIAYRYK